MKTTSPLARSNKFARYAAASAAALGAAAAADAQFTGDYTLEGPAANTFTNPSSPSSFGNWTFQQLNTSGSFFASITTSTGASLDIVAEQGTSYSVVEFGVTAAGTGNVTFDYSTTADAGLLGGGSGSFQYYVNGINHFVTSISESNSVTFAVSSGDVFGFRIAGAYATYASMGVTFTNFSAPLAAVPEPGTTGLLVGVASLGFVGLMMNRKLRERAVVQAAS